MKKMLALLFALMMLFSLSAAAEETTDTLPVMTQLLGTPLGDFYADQEMGCITFYYTPVTEDHLYAYLTLSAGIGKYASPLETDRETLQAFYLMSPGQPLSTILIYDEEEQKLEVNVYAPFDPLMDDVMNGLLDYLSQGFVYPEGMSGYLLPQFWALTNTKPEATKHVTGIDYIFNGKKTYVEEYHGVSPDVIVLYTRIMMRYGYDVFVDLFSGSDDLVNEVILHYYNDEMEVILAYVYDAQVAQVATKPGIVPFILSPSQINESFGQ